MKLIINIMLFLLLMITASCSNYNSVFAEKQELEKVLHVVQNIHMFHTDYLIAEDVNLKEYYGRQLLITLKDLDTINYTNSPLELIYQISTEPSTNNILQVSFGSGYHGIAWIVDFDSTLNEINNKHFIIDVNALLENSYEF